MSQSWRKLYQTTWLLPVLLFLNACSYVDSLLGREPEVVELPPVGFCTDTGDSCMETGMTPPPVPTPTPLVAAGPALPAAPRATTTAAVTPTSALPTDPIQPATPAPTAAVESGSPVITFFQADVAEADPGQSITLSWATTRALTVTLWRMAATGQFGQFWDVPASGEFNYPIADSERNSISFTLVATADTNAYVMETLSVPLRCPFIWFFAGAPEICPAAAALTSAAAEQPFEHGVMIWVEAEAAIYVLADAPGMIPNWRRYADAWQEGDAPDDAALSPPPGLYQPQRGFGLVWREEAGVREQLGWATAPEVGFTTTVQRTSYVKYNHTYIQAADGGIWHLQPEGSGWGQE